MKPCNFRIQVQPRPWAIALWLVLSGLVGFRSEAASTTTVVMNNFSFSPSAITVNVGDTVLWVNEVGTHTVTGSGADLFCGTPPVPVSCSVTFLLPGVFPYVCLIHESQGMFGTVTVVDANPPVRVAITSPTANQSLPTSGEVSLTATNTAEVTFSQVEYFDGERSLGIATNAPFLIDATLSIGTHTLTARATETGGTATTSAPVAVTVDYEIPNPVPKVIARGTTVIDLETVLDGLASPLGLAPLNDSSGRLLVYDQVGLVHVIADGKGSDTPFLDVRSRLVALNTTYDERGLLGLATHPQFTQKPLLYTLTSEPSGPPADFPIVLPAGQTNNHQSVLAEWQIDPANTNRVLPESRREILRWDKPQANHNGGTLHFGADGFLYIVTGDGGAADDQGAGHLPGGNAQSRSNLLGKVLRIDVNARTSPNGQYGNPADNPFASQAGAAGEIYAYGFRNPYAFSFDKTTGELWLADVGQNQIEEIDLVTKGGNFGWPHKEGSFFFNQNGNNQGYVTQTPVGELPPDLVDPVAEYDHDEGEAIIGGFVYRGAAIPRLQGTYITGDYGQSAQSKGRLFAVKSRDLTELRIGVENRSLGLYLKGFGEDLNGEIYVLGSTNSGPSGTTGKVLKIIPPSANTIALIASELVSEGLHLVWAGGTPPYVVQRKNELSDASWVEVSSTSESELTVPTTGASGFFRVIDPVAVVP